MVCILKPSEYYGLYLNGTIRITDELVNKDGGLKFTLDVDGFPNYLQGNKIGIAVHENGDISKGCQNIGGHYNPHKAKFHGSNMSSLKEKHLGDMGNMFVKDGKSTSVIYNRDMRLFGSFGISGRSIRLGSYEDDEGKGDQNSKIDGNLYEPWGCCQITTKDSASKCSSLPASFVVMLLFGGILVVIVSVL
ncbi:hypothetical protein HELRODRAFT_178838 [Helobdella robusta]|uniref:Superoxide dismutase copper/zinc binding domain-containing protein n=1 Tax=Helobdella robusta TaxID=6412 RepID=T1FDT4_HELRO|nr:hypothetical protein HELRODRAFT_178838 [Helobdella robusta]ESN95921.1 hypothetical protein HELRODRAFT_178838 [Helobdella robusta]